MPAAMPWRQINAEGGYQTRHANVESNQEVVVSKIKTSRFAAADYLDSEEMIAGYINAALEHDDVDLLMAAIADVAKARGIAKVAEDAGVGRESLAGFCLGVKNRPSA